MRGADRKGAWACCAAYSPSWNNPRPSGMLGTLSSSNRTGSSGDCRDELARHKGVHRQNDGSTARPASTSDARWGSGAGRDLPVGSSGVPGPGPRAGSSGARRARWASSRLGGREDEIRRFLELGVAKTAIANTGVSRTALYSFMSTRGLRPTP